MLSFGGDAIMSNRPATAFC